MALEVTDARISQQKIDHLDEQIAKLTAGLPSPDIARGKQIFTKNCAICHKLGDEGAKIGPQLDGIGIRGVARVMEDVLDPNRNVDQSFRTTTLVTTNGLTIS